MSAPRWVVLAATAVVASPLVGLLAAGDVDTETAVMRVLVCGAVSWAAIGLVWSFVVPDPPARVPVAAPATPPGATGAGSPDATTWEPPAGP